MALDDPYAAHTALIETVLAGTCRSHRLAPDHADEFQSWARLRLLDDNRAILRKFGGRSSLRTFLVTVIERLFLDWRNHEWGKWRPSSEARRLGQVAIELERLVLRDHTPFHEAVSLLVSRGLAPDPAACETVWARLPRKPRRQRASEKELADRPSAAEADDPVEESERTSRRTALVMALRRAVESLPPADQTLVQLRYWSGIKVSQIAVLTGEDQKPLYRRFERIERDMLQHLAAAGFTGVGDVFAAGYAAEEVESNGQGAPATVEARAEGEAKGPMGPSTATKTGVAHV